MRSGLFVLAWAVDLFRAKRGIPFEFRARLPLGAHRLHHPNIFARWERGALAPRISTEKWALAPAPLGVGYRVNGNPLLLQLRHSLPRRQDLARCLRTRPRPPEL